MPIFLFSLCIYLSVEGSGKFRELQSRPEHYSVRSGCLQKFAERLGKESLVLTQLVVKKSTDVPSHFVHHEAMRDLIDEEEHSSSGKIKQS